jgi:lysophospholipase L1-like esterase
MDTISEVALLDSKQNAEDLAEIANQRARKNIIAILSDSIGVAYNAFSYTRYLTWIPGLVVRNHTMGGYRIQDATNTLIPQMFAVKPIPEKAITMIGINNYFHNDTIEIAKAEYIEMVATLVKNNIIPIICTIAPLKDPTAWIVNFNRWLRYFARTNGYQLVDAYSAYYDAAGTLKTNYLQEDGVHATSLGEYAIY